MDWRQNVGHRLKPRELHIFVTVVEQGNMARAAEVLAISRPVISKAINNIEHLLGVRLLDRHAAGIEPTHFGQMLYRRSLAIFDEIRSGIEEIATAQDPSTGEIRFGATEGIMAGLVPCALKRISRKFPGFSVRTFTGNSDLLLKQLVDRRCELIITRSPLNLDRSLIREEPLYCEQLQVVVGKSHESANKRQITLRDLIDHQWILAPVEIEAHAPVREAFEKQKLPLPRSVIYSQSRSLRISLLESGKYVTFMPKSVLSMAPKHDFLKVLPIDIPPWRIPITISSLANKTLSPISYVLIDALKECAGLHINAEAMNSA